MTAAVLFWVIWLLTLLFGGVGYWKQNPPGPWIGGFWIAVWVELGLLAWKLFGPPVQ